MTERTYEVSLTGTITVDDTTVRSGLLGVHWYPEPGQPEMTEEERLELDEQFLSYTATLPPDRLLQSYLANVPLLEARAQLERWLEARLPGSRVEVGSAWVDEVAFPEAGRGDPAP
jgi:hypothetical protein